MIQEKLVSDYKIDTLIPIPITDTPVRRTRGPARKRCKHGTCLWVPVSDHAYKEKCSACGDIFPCEPLCAHVDCCEAQGIESPYLESQGGSLSFGDLMIKS